MLLLAIIVKFVAFLTNNTESSVWYPFSSIRDMELLYTVGCGTFTRILRQSEARQTHVVIVIQHKVFKILIGGDIVQKLVTNTSCRMSNILTTSSTFLGIFV